MSNALEEGELSDDSDCYVPLQRPVDYSSFSATIIKPQAPPIDSESDYNNKSTSDSDSDSDGATTQKRPKLKPRPRQSTVTKPINHKYNVWSTRIQEEVLVDTLNTCDVTKKDRSRDVESYDYPIRDNFNENFDGRRDLREILTRKNKGKNNVEVRERMSNKRSRDDRKNKKLRLVGKTEEDDDDGRGAPRILMDLVVNVGNSYEEIARDLANKLSETKEDLLLKIVTVLGKEKSIKIFMEVKRIEAEGGMLIMNQSRRRTPGGVYLFLLKHDDNLSREQKDKIFEDERQKSKDEIRAQKKNKNVERKMKMKNKIKLPELLTADKLCIEKMTKEWSNERDVTEHEEVENPPPTPETDYNDTADDQKVIDDISGRQHQEYDEEFLDLGGANDMDFF